ncbi:transglycosylase SLT domain-containing protein [bacterium]|nr:transglycosylase SLT domain-containing protein [bacterium]
MDEASKSKKAVQKTVRKKTAAPVKKNDPVPVKQIFFYVTNTLKIASMLILVAVGAVFIIRNAQTVKRLKNEVIDLKYAMNTDSVRQHKLQKIINIIKQYNNGISSEQAYDIANTIHEMSMKYTNLDIDLLCAVITHESANTWDPAIVSPAGAMGLMQIMPVTGMFLAEYEEITWTEPEEVLFNPVYNIRMGSRYLSSLIQEYDLEAALAAYNGGERIAAVYLANGKDNRVLWEETRKYIPAVINLYHSYISQSM